MPPSPNHSQVTMNGPLIQHKSSKTESCWVHSKESPETVKFDEESPYSSLSSTSSDKDHQIEIISPNVSGTSSKFDLSVAKQAVCEMGIPAHLVQQVIDSRLLERGQEFTSTIELFTAADEVAQSPLKQAELAKKLYLAEQYEKKKKEAEKPVESAIITCHTSPVKLSAEMPRVAAHDKASDDKSQLKERVKVLAKENQKLRNRKVCRACRKVELSTSGITFLPCGHFITCEKCAELYDDCLACGKNIMGTVRTFLS